MVASVSKSCFAKVAVFFALLFALANCSSFEDIVHSRGLKTIGNCSIVYQGTTWVGGNIARPIRGLGWATECCAYCNENYGNITRAYIYLPNPDRCYCKDQVNRPIPCRTCQGRNNDEQPTPSDCNPVYNYDSVDNDLPRTPISNVTQPGDCCENCRRYGSLCAAWVWRRDRNTCYLKSVPGELVYNPVSVYGTP